MGNLFSSMLSRDEAMLASRTRSYSLAFPGEGERGDEVKKRKVLGETCVHEPSPVIVIESKEVAGDASQVRPGLGFVTDLEAMSTDLFPGAFYEFGALDVFSMDLNDPSSLLELPYDVLFLISKLVQTALSTKEWPALMYSCRFWNSMLAGPLLRDVGFLHESLHFGAPSRFTLELSGLDVYPALLHWRRSEQFVHVDTVKFKLSRDGLVRDLQLSCLAKFFASLPLGMRLFRVVHFFLADYECGINVAALKDVILGVHRTGCLDLWIYSSYLAEVGTSDVVHLDEVEYTHEMERVTFQSPSVFSMALFPWFVRTLEAGTSLTSVDVVSVGLDPSRWSDILPSITLPRLQCLRLVGVDLVTLADFLHRHPSLQSIRLDGLYMDGPVPPSRRLMLPNLNTIEGNDSQIASFLAIVNPLRSLCFMTVVFREDCSMEIPSSFATEPCLTAFRHLARLQKAGYLSLSFNFSSLCKVSQPSFFLDQGESRPERLISVDRLEINVFGQSTAESIELLDGCIRWAPMFKRIKYLQIWVSNGVLPDALRNQYLESFLQDLPETRVRFC